MPPIHFIHVGLAKTASTWLQREVLPYHPQLWVIRTGMGKPEFIDCVRELWKFNDNSFDASEWRSTFNELVARYAPEQQLVGISSENLAGNLITGAQVAVIADRLAGFFPRTKIILVLRHPVDYVLSVYNQYVRMGGLKSLRGFLTDTTIPGRAITNRLDYQNLIRLYTTRFGRENVLVLPLEWLREDADAYLQAIWTFLGVDTLDKEQVRHRKRNPSLSSLSLTLLRLGNLLERDPKTVRRRLHRMDMIASRRFFRFPPLSLSFEWLTSIEGGTTYPSFADVLLDENYKIWEGELARFNYQFP